MRITRVIPLILLVPALLLGQRPSEELNARIPQWVRFSIEERVRGEALTGVGFLEGAGNAYLLSRFRVSTDIRPTSWLKFELQAQDSRVFGTNVRPAPATQKDALDLRVGFVQLGSQRDGSIWLRAGRQPLDFGDGRLIADPNWSNVGRSFDAARFGWKRGRFQLDLLSGLVERISQQDLNLPSPGEHLHGAVVSFKRLIPLATVDPYAFWRLCGSGVTKLDEKTYGALVSGKISVQIDYTVEAAWQRGSLGAKTISAWAHHAVAGYQFTQARGKPRVYGEFNFGSGDPDPRDGRRENFDVLFPSSHDKFGSSDLLCWSNLEHLRSGLQFQVSERLRVHLALNAFWVAQKQDGIYSGGRLVVNPYDAHSRHVGLEPDVLAEWKMTRYSVVHFSYGRLLAGAFLTGAGRGSASTSALGFTKVL